MAKEYRSETLNCKDSNLTVAVDPENWDGIVLIKGVRTDYDGEGRKVEVDFEVDETQINYLIEALTEAKLIAELNSGKTGSKFDISNA